MNLLLAQLQDRIEAREAVIGVIGLGYVGLPVACSFAQAGFEVVGVDIDAGRVDLIQAGVSPIEGDEPGLADLLAEVVASGRFLATTEYDHLALADVVLIDVETPVDDDHIPRYRALQTAVRSLAPVLKRGGLVIVESTISPGTVDHLVRPLLEAETGRQANRDFYLGACPERVMPGKLLANLRQLSRVCGGSTPEVAETMAALYRHVVEADLDTADCLTAELVKTTENAYRDVQIAFANEVALICEAVGGDVWRVRELVNKTPYRQMHRPGAGVGGHCIPKDPWLLAHGLSHSDRQPPPLRLIPAARDINDGMPRHVGDLTLAALEASGISPAAAKVAVLGYAYLENSDDTRNSPSAALVDYLRRQGITVAIHDPWVTEYDQELLATAVHCDAAVFMVAHTAYRQLDLRALKESLRTPVLIDGRHLFTKAEAEAAGLTYYGVGQGAAPT
jgi:UDP-N-acetyl-D-mannosaminuronic acid dehydrogenase